MDEGKINLIVSELGNERVKQKEQIKYHTYTKVGGPAQLFYIATNQKELLKVLNLALELKVPFMVLGAGSKIFISEKGFDGLVIKNRTSNIKISGIKGKVGQNGIGIEEALIELDSGVSLAKLNDFLVENKLQEIKGLSFGKSTAGGSILIDRELQRICQKIIIWENGQTDEIDLVNLNIKKHVVLSIVVKVKA